MEESSDAAAWRERLAQESDPAAILSAFAHWTAAFFATSRATLDLADPVPPEVAELAAEGDAHRRAALDALLARPEFTGALAPGLDHRRAVDRAWLLTGLATFRGAVQGCDWTAQEYADWLSTTLQQQVLDRTWWRAET